MSLKSLANGPKAEINVSEQDIREQVSRLLDSPIFVQSGRLSRFLRFTIETTLAGNSEALKEYLIGTEVYDRKPPYHPSADSIVRSEARRLRSKLRQYYQSFGKDDPVFIYYRLGSYIPVFRLRPKGPPNSHSETHEALDDLLRESLAAQDFDFPSAELNVQIIFEGTVRVLCSTSTSSTKDKPFHKARPSALRKVISMSLKKPA
ncbi:MAG TPA: hypothetical protein VMH20_02195 [Verrucomicrobiae bacterium]|nr:hypothetical protein [Verrucomicrobiae bacterium]